MSETTERVVDDAAVSTCFECGSSNIVSNMKNGKTTDWKCHNCQMWDRTQYYVEKKPVMVGLRAGCNSCNSTHCYGCYGY